MSDLGSYVRRMIDGGMDAAEAATIAAQIFQAGVSAAPYRDPAPVRDETAHDRKKAYDRRYRQNERATSYDNRTTSDDSYDSGDLKGSTPPKDHPPKENPPKGGQKKGSRLPADWKPSELDEAFARAEGIPASDVPKVAAKFGDYWRGVAGAKGSKLDWPATWRNWCRDEAKKYLRRPGQPNAIPGQTRWAI